MKQLMTRHKWPGASHRYPTRRMLSQHLQVSGKRKARAAPARKKKAPRKARNAKATESDGEMFPLGTLSRSYELKVGGLCAGVDEAGRGPLAGPVVAAGEQRL
jgi:hypothetical protein